MASAPACLSVFAWNCNGIKSKVLEFRDFINELSPDIFLLQETHLRPGDKLNIPNYNTYRNDAPPSLVAYRGTAITIKRNIPHHTFNLPTLNCIHATGIIINIPNTPPLLIISVYLPPNNRATDINADLIKLTNLNPDTILLGDFNATHRLWKNNHNNHHGVTIYNYTANTDTDIIAPDTPTHHTRTSANIIDFALVRGVPHQMHISTIEDLSSDHYPLQLNIDIQHSFPAPTTKTYTNWTDFKTNLEKLSPPVIIPNSPSDIDSLALNISTNIINAYHNSTKTYTCNTTQTKDKHLITLKRNRNRARKTYQSTHNPTHKTLMNHAQQLLKSYLSTKANNNWKNYISNLTPDNNSIWKAARRFKNTFHSIPPLHHPTNNQIANSDTDKANLIAEQLSKQFTPNNSPNHHMDNIIQTNINLLINTPHDPPISNISASEIINAIKARNKNKSPGHDHVTYTMLLNLPHNYYTYISNLINSIIINSHFPEYWKNSIIIPILKPDKPKHSPNSYRPISLLSTISKIAEHFIAKHLNEHINNNNILLPQQFGFRKNLSAPHQIYRIAEQISKSLQDKHSTAALFLDIAKAFDKIHHPSLIHKLINLNFPPFIIKLIISYISNRNFKVKINKALSNTFPISSGVAQGSLLGPTLFLLYINDLPQHHATEIGIFADDTAITSTNKNPKYAILAINHHMRLISQWLHTWRITLNKDKCIAIMFTHKFRRTYRHYNIKIDNTDIPWSDSCKYLGVILDSKLTWNPHITHILTKFRAAKRLLLPLIARNSVLDLNNKLLIYKSLLRPLLTYACPAWSYAAKTTINKLLIAQNLTIRYMLKDIPWYFRNIEIYHDINLPPLEDFLNKLTKNFHNKNLLNNITIMLDLADYDQADRANRKRPRAVLT